MATQHDGDSVLDLGCYSRFCQRRYAQQAAHDVELFTKPVSNYSTQLPLLGIYLILWSTLIFPIHTMTPVWVFPAYPLLITAPFGGNLINSAVKVGMVDRINGLVIALAAVAIQGTGFLLSLAIISAYIYRLFTRQSFRPYRRDFQNEN